MGRGAAVVEGPRRVSAPLGPAAVPVADVERLLAAARPRVEAAWRAHWATLPPDSVALPHDEAVFLDRHATSVAVLDPGGSRRTSAIGRVGDDIGAGVDLLFRLPGDHRVRARFAPDEAFLTWDPRHNPSAALAAAITSTTDERRVPRLLAPFVLRPDLRTLVPALCLVALVGMGVGLLAAQVALRDTLGRAGAGDWAGVAGASLGLLLILAQPPGRRIGSVRVETPRLRTLRRLTTAALVLTCLTAAGMAVAIGVLLGG